MKKWLWNVFVASSILLGSIFFGTYKTTLSANLGRIYDDSAFARGFCRVLEVVLSDPEHCQNEYRDLLEERRK